MVVVKNLKRGPGLGTERSIQKTKAPCRSFQFISHTPFLGSLPWPVSSVHFSSFLTRLFSDLCHGPSARFISVHFSFAFSRFFAMTRQLGSFQFISHTPFLGSLPWPVSSVHFSSFLIRLFSVLCHGPSARFISVHFSYAFSRIFAMARQLGSFLIRLFSVLCHGPSARFISVHFSYAFSRFFAMARQLGSFQFISHTPFLGSLSWPVSSVLKVSCVNASKMIA